MKTDKRKEGNKRREKSGTTKEIKKYNSLYCNPFVFIFKSMKIMFKKIVQINCKNLEFQ